MGRRKINIHERRSQKGDSLLEVILAIAIFMLIAPAIVIVALRSLSGSIESEDRIVAAALAQETLEASRAIRDYDWDSLITGNHGLSDANGYWEFVGTSDNKGKYTRAVAISDTDASTKKIVAAVSWQGLDGISNSISPTGQLTKWHSLQWMQNLAGSFLSGFANSVEIDEANGGIKLSNLGDWSQPSVLVSTNFSGDADGKSIFIDKNNLYLVTKNEGSGKEFIALDLSDVTKGNLTTLGSAELGTNANHVTVFNGYAYVATDSNSEEIMIVRLSDYAKIGSINMPGGIAVSDFAKDNILAVGTAKSSGGREFFTYDISNPESSLPLSGSAEINAKVNDIYISGNYAYLATDDNGKELIIVRLSDNSIVNFYNLPDTADAHAVFVAGNAAYIGRDNSSVSEFYALDISNPEGTISPLGDVDLGSAEIKDIFIAGSHGYISTENGGTRETAVLNLNNYSVEIWIDIEGGAPADAVWMYGRHIYVGSRENTETLQVIQGGTSTSSDLAQEGIFTSQKFDTGAAATAYQNISWISIGTGTVSFQIRTADTEANLNSAKWVGPDGAENSYYTVSDTQITLDPAASGSRWFQYRAILNGDGLESPILKDVSITYVN